MTYNIRFANPGDGINTWENRKDLVTGLIRFHEADIIGLQEALRMQLDDIEKALPSYSWCGVSRTDGSTTPQPDNEFSAILYRTDRFTLEQGGTFWLSETPFVAGSKSWDAALPRIVTWARFLDRQTAQRFYHFNTHFDHMGVKARMESAYLLQEKVDSIVRSFPAPVVITGDFNCTEKDPPYRLLTTEKNYMRLWDAKTISQQKPYGPSGTFSPAFLANEVSSRCIDHIFVNDMIVVMRHGILTDNLNGRLPSDHLPVLTEIQFR